MTKQEEIKVLYIRVNVESLTKLKDIIHAPRSVDLPAKFRDQMKKTFNLAYGNDRGASALIAGRSWDLIHAEHWYGIVKWSKPFNIRYWVWEVAIVFRQAKDDADLTNFETCDWAWLSATWKIEEGTNANSPSRGCSMPSSSADSRASTVSNWAATAGTRPRAATNGRAWTTSFVMDDVTRGAGGSRTVTHLYTDNVEVRIGAWADRDVRGEFWRKVVSCVMMSSAL